MRKLALLAIVTASLGAMSLPAIAATPGYGKRVQVGQLAKQLDALEKPLSAKQAAKKPSFMKRQPLLQKIAAFLRPGLSVKDDVRRIDAFIARTEERFGAPISTLQHPAMKDGQRMRAEKAFALIEFNRRPEEVTEHFVHAKSQVAGAPAIEDREVFVQRWRPTGTPSGKLFVMSPGFQLTGRNFYEQVQLLNKEGHEVLVMDHQWAGYTAGKNGVKKGAIDSAEGVARDFADVAGFGNEILEKEYGKHPGKQLITVGDSMGGGPGMLYALKLYDAGMIKLPAGRSIPADRGYIGQGAFLGRTKSLINNSLNLVGRIPVVRNIPLPAMGLPLLSDDAFENAKLAAHAASENTHARPSAMRTPLPGLDKLIAMLKEGPPKGRGFFIHAENDYLANPKLVTSLFGNAGKNVKVKLVPGRNHVMEETKGEQSYLLEAAKFVTSKE